MEVMNAIAIQLLTLFNSLPTNDGNCRHDLYELSISLWEFIWGFLILGAISYGW